MSDETKHPVERAWHAWSNSAIGTIANLIIGIAICVTAGKLLVWAVTL